jgi:hypothetical protein
MGIGFDSDSFLITHIRPLIQDPGLSKRLVFSSVVKSTKMGGTQEKTEVDSETTGVVISNPTLSPSELKQLMPDGEISEEIVRVFFIEADLAFTIQNGYALDIYKSLTLLGNYRVKAVSRNMVVPEVVVALCVTGR